MKNKEYDLAIEALGEFIDTNKSQMIVSETTYQKAITYYENGDMANAMSNFIDVKDYKEAGTYLQEYYELGKEYLDSKKYDEAIEIFENLNNYSFSSHYLEVAKSRGNH